MVVVLVVATSVVLVLLVFATWLHTVQTATMAMLMVVLDTVMADTSMVAMAMVTLLAVLTRGCKVAVETCARRAADTDGDAARAGHGEHAHEHGGHGDGYAVGDADARVQGVLCLAGETRV